MSTNNWEDVRKTIYEFNSYEENYDGIGSLKPSAESILVAMTTSYKLEYISAKPPTRAFPVGGQICFEWELFGEMPADGKTFIEMRF